MKEFKITNIAEFVDYIDKLKNRDELWFRGVAKTSYLPVPGIVWRNAMHKESSIEHDFLVSYKAYAAERNLTPWEIFSLMQHHGLPTRLLDWSESALVALFFSLTSEPTYNGYRAVWVLNPYSLNKKTINSATLYCPAIIAADEFELNGDVLKLNSYLPPNLTPTSTTDYPNPPIAINATQNLRRISSQKGCFTVHGKNPDSIDTYLSNPDDFHMIKVDARSKEKRKEMVRVLAKLGINEEFIYQDLDSLCRRIIREHGF
ncbi:MAG: FRG domain-containing protein [Pseudomonas sp.]|uniref:FRG domain-containing protein n=1 Tax=Pseudomonas sp. TaxID=306 RepID=UPI00271A1534|nr:FRG domain-containing protein [Pseudomonas sp.]MDO9619425.1 FRG domain-containing protein [Pseudomonas sp.]MDP2447374.1 FRG domain-containing protein [Pseudomonas sp.]MDZ4298845.1 FRG domain-containing protein [Moraxellaceae bacterium]